MMKRLICVLMMLMLACPALGEGATEGSFPTLNEDGFYDGGEFVYTDEDSGVWRYCSNTLKVEIFRRTSDDPKEVWYEAEIWSTEDNAFSMIPNDAEKRMTSTEYPYKIARKNGTVVAVNSDFAHLRIQQKSRVGVLLRAGEILSERTLRKNKGTFPNLDTLALFPDGDMQVFWSDEKTAQEYIDMGASDVLAFGPWLIRDGELNETGLKKYGTSKAPRTAVGMVEKGHYFLMVVEGRHNESKGGAVSFLAEKLLGKGCTLGFNLDGGQSSGLVFMGEQISRVGSNNRVSTKSCRKAAEILGIGHSGLVPAVGE